MAVHFKISSGGYSMDARTILCGRDFLKRSIAALLVGVLLLGGCAGAANQSPNQSDNTQTDAAQLPEDSRQIASPSGNAQVGKTKPERPQVPTAADYIESRLAEADRVLYVYKDFVDGANYYTQKAWISDYNGQIPAMREDAEGRNGTTGIVAHIDLAEHTWGGYMFVNGVLKAGATVPELDFGTTDAGLDLTGATSLTFWARGEHGGEYVEFFMGTLGNDAIKDAPFADTSGKLSTGYVRLEREWQRFEIPLDGADLTRIGCGFGWVTNEHQSGYGAKVDFYLDDIRYEFDTPRSRPIFLTSYAPAAAGTDAAVINNFAYLYDQCVAAMALSYAGKHERARQIADAIVYAVNNDRFYKDGRLRNAYMGGNPKSYPRWLSSRGREFARMSGFYDAEQGEYFEDAYSVGTSTGNCAWAILALLEVYANAADDPVRDEYLDAATRVAGFILTLESGDGFTGGYEGWEPEPLKVGYKSTEHNTDLIAAFGRLAKITGEAKYASATDSAERFVLSMYDEERGCFYTGTGDDGVTPNKDVIPLDCQTWTLSVLGDGFDANKRDKVLAFIDAHIAVEGGYDFEADSFDGIWNEGTAQVGVLCYLMGDDKRAEEIISLLQAGRLPDGSITAADRDGVSTGFKVSGMDIPWEYDRRQHLGATAWLSFLQQGGRNPFAY
jgi:hypothetical protein